MGEKPRYYVVYSAVDELVGDRIKGYLYSEGPLETKADIERVIKEVLVANGDLSHVVLENWKRIS